jgi:hypothetical protein
MAEIKAGLAEATEGVAETKKDLLITLQRPEELKQEFLDALLRSEPITPKNRPPPPLTKDLPWIREDDIKFFNDFEDFADVINWWMNRDNWKDIEESRWESRWRLQERPTFELSIFGGEYPDYGRSYEIFYNQANIGLLEAASFPGSKARVEIALDYVSLLSFSEVRSFLGVIAYFICHTIDGQHETPDPDDAIDRELAATLWDAFRASGRPPNQMREPYPWLKLYLSGTAEYYFHYRQALREKRNDEPRQEQPST